MKLEKRSWVFGAKVVVAAGLLVALAGYFAAKVAPDKPVSALLEHVLPSALLFLLLVVPLIVFTLAMMQWALRMGGTDPQWFWFPSEPRGLVKLREEAGRRHTEGAASPVKGAG